jgi:hypothetical protein
MSSIKAIFVVERLNEVFGLGGWKQVSKFVEKVEKPIEGPGSKKGDMIVVKSAVIVPKYGIYFETFGGHNNADAGDAYKGACTDALTKIGSFMYIGMDVFKGHPETAGQAAPQPAAAAKPKAQAAATTTAPAQPVAETTATAPVLKCADCKNTIGPFKSGTKEYPADSVAATARARYNLDLCAGCQKVRKEAAAAATPAAAVAAARLNTNATPKEVVQ